MDDKVKAANKENNIYMVLGINSSEEMYAKANIVAAIILKMQECCLTTAEVSVILQMDVKILSAIISGHFQDFSICELERIREAI